MAESVVQRGVSANISTATTTTVSSQAGTLMSITVLGGTAGAVTIYDNTAASGVVLVQAFTPQVTTVPYTLRFNVGYTKGLTIVTAAATLLQVTYQ